MDLAGIGAVAAAAVAAVGIPSALVVGRWQLRGAMRATEEAGRVGIAQAEASYRAALDAVRATATEAHTQWLRGVRREAYSAFMFACSQALHTAEQLVVDSEGKRITAEQRDARVMGLDDAIGRLEHSVLIVQLEGPEELAQRAEQMAAAAIEAARKSRTLFDLHEAWLDLERMANAPDADLRVVRFYQSCKLLRAITLDDVHSVPEAELEEGVRLTLEEMEQYHIDLPSAVFDSSFSARYYARGVSYTEARVRAEQMSRFLTLRQAFVEAAREVLDTTR